MKKSMTLGAGVFLLCAAIVSDTVAQNQVQRYYPQRPAISPYMNYFSGPAPGGGLDRHNFYVRPAQRLQQTLNNQQSQIMQLGNQVQQQQQQGQPLATPTGIGGVFNNYSHYYPNQPAQGRRR